jgi:hypothetical protein
MQVQDTPQCVVAWDPSGEYWDGAVVPFAQAQALRQRGAVCLPCVPDLFRLSGVGGYAKRSWGAGLPLDSVAPALVAPITLFLQPDIKGLTWAARLVPDYRGDALSRSRGRSDGLVRFSADSAQRIPTHGFYTEISGKATLVRELGDPDEAGGWTVGGDGHLSISGEGHYGFALYATAPGLRVAWVAAACAPLRV